jgi:3-phosphoglycerate kinase
MYNRTNFFDLIEKAKYTNIHNLNEKIVILRSCLNVTVNKDGEIVDRTRLNDAYPTIKELAQKVSKLIIVGHLGRPIVKDKHLSLANVAKEIDSRLNGDLDLNCSLVESIDEAANSSAKVLMLENIRFFDDEESNNVSEIDEFAKELATLADIFINDSFPDYRVSASTYYIAKHIPAFLGPNFIKEAINLYQLSNPKRPFVAILGGAKLSEKLDSMEELLKYTDKILVGGAMAYTILKAKNIKIGNSLYEDDKLDVALDMLNNYHEKIVLPIDHYVAEDFNSNAAETGIITKDENIPDDMIAVDIGNKTIKHFIDHIKDAKTILLNGPMGVYEWHKCDLGTKDVYKAAADNSEAFSIIAGGDSIAAINKFRITGFEHISKGGGATLAFIATNEFPTLDIILDQYA